MDEGRETGPRYAQSTATQKEGTRTRGKNARVCAKRERPRSRALSLDPSCVSPTEHEREFSHRGSRERVVQPLGGTTPSRRARRKTKRRGGLLLSRSISPVIRTLGQARTDRPGEYRRFPKRNFIGRILRKTKIQRRFTSHLELQLF